MMKTNGQLDYEKLDLAQHKWLHCHDYYHDCVEIETVKEIAPKSKSIYYLAKTLEL